MSDSRRTIPYWGGIRRRGTRPYLEGSFIIHMPRFEFHFPGRVPFEVGEKVYIAGEPGTYLVVRIDRRRCLADVMLMGQNARMEFGVHFAAITRAADQKSPSRRRLVLAEPAFEGAEAND